ncbi:MAG TPA: hypothetical protein VJ810_30290 [Blastocatellia bacterium]|nr:hypothetical protein [Blastocatellia bacterium]
MKSNIAVVPKNAILAGFNPIFTSRNAPWRFGSWRFAPGVSPLALRPWGSALGVPMDGLMDRYSPRRGEIDLSYCRRFQKLRGTDGVIIIQQGCFDLTAVRRTFFRFLDTPNNQTV